MKYDLIDCCPVPHRLAPVMRLVLTESGTALQSCYRADDAAALLAKCGKHSQTWLYEHQGTPAQPNPANPPGRSTHELRNDGVAYRFPAGTRLPYWCVGIDIDDAHVQAFMSAARAHKYIATITYPGSRLEYHHVNFRREPIVALPALKRGSGGPRAQLLKRRLHRLGYLAHYVRGPIGAGAVEAIKAFQKAQRLPADGVAGVATQHALAVALRRQKHHPPVAPKDGLTAEQRTYAARAKAKGAHFAETIVLEADREGVQLSLAFALVEQETGFQNIFGHDPTIYAGAGAVTRRKYLAYKRQRGTTRMQGVGPCQLTWWATQDLADREGGCWKPSANIRVGLRTLAQNVKQYGPHAGVARYNGSGAAAEAYARSVEAKQQRWHTILTGGK